MLNKYKKQLIIASTTIILVLLALIVFVFLGLQGASNDSKLITFSVKAGANKLEIIEDLSDAGIIKNQYATSIYALVNFNLNMQAGVYKLDKSMNSIDILNQISNGDTNIYQETISVRFPEGKRVTHYAEIISEKFGYAYEDVIKVFESDEYAKTLISKYSFLTDEILDEQIYYPLEGYLFPDTYEFYTNSTIEEIIEKLVAQMELKTSEIKTSIDDSGYTFHEILTIASIAEMEATNASDRQKVSQVIYSRLAVPMTLGMDVTTYYGSKLEMGSILTELELYEKNGYNTRALDFYGLPVGAICNSSYESILAALNPSESSYIFFIADTVTGEVFFYETESGFLAKKAELRALGHL